jgi:hypothetical protein
MRVRALLAAAALAAAAYPTSPEEMRPRIAREIARWQRVVEMRKIERQ